MLTRSDLAVTRVRHSLKFRLLQVKRVQPLTPHLIRVTFTGDDLHDFESASFDDHIKVFFPAPGADKPVRFGSYPARIGSYEAWSGTMTSDAMKMVLAVPHLQMAEATLVSGGKVNQEIFDIDTSGLEPAWTQLVASCPASPGNLKPVASPVVTSAPVQ